LAYLAAISRNGSHPGPVASSRRIVYHGVGVGLESRTLVRLAPAEVIRLQSHNHITLLMLFLGEASFCGICKKKPKLKDPIRLLASKDTIELIVGQEDSLPQVRKWNYDGSTGMELKFCLADDSLSVVIMYK